MYQRLGQRIHPISCETTAAHSHNGLRKPKHNDKGATCTFHTLSCHASSPFPTPKTNKERERGKNAGRKNHSDTEHRTHNPQLGGNGPRADGFMDPRPDKPTQKETNNPQFEYNQNGGCSHGNERENAEKGKHPRQTHCLHPNPPTVAAAAPGTRATIFSHPARQANSVHRGRLAQRRAKRRAEVKVTTDVPGMRLCESDPAVVTTVPLASAPIFLHQARGTESIYRCECTVRTARWSGTGKEAQDASS
jgi:hypothetical protein